MSDTNLPPVNSGITSLPILVREIEIHPDVIEPNAWSSFFPSSDVRLVLIKLH